MDIDQDQTAEDSTAAPTVSDSSPPAPPAKSILSLHFMGLEGDPIQGLEAQVTINGQQKTYITDAAGYLPDIEAKSGAPFELAVKRFDGSFKTIDQCEVPPNTRTSWQYASPKSVFEVETQEHEGTPGTIEDQIPQAKPSDNGDRPTAIDLTTEPTEEIASAPADPAPPVSAPASVRTPAPTSTPKPAPATKPVAAKPAKPVAPPHISGKPDLPVKDASKTVGRDAQGVPMVVIAKEKLLDWWNSWHLPTFNLWGEHHRATESGGAAASAGSEKVKVPFTPDMPAKVRALIEFAEEHAAYTYPPSTRPVLASMANGTFKPPGKGAKPKSTSLGQCYEYVKIALSRCGIVDRLLADEMTHEIQESASKSGPALLARGFVDVTDEVPDPRWAAAGDIIVYEWSAKTWAQRKIKKENPNLPNHGHIDIRSVDSYISDFMPRLKYPEWVVEDPPKSGKYRTNYVNIRIYRKYYDPLPTCRMRAFLHCLRDYECQGVSKDDDRYSVLHSPLPGDSSHKKSFNGFDTHPWDSVAEDKREGTASGAYQIIYKNWKSLFSRGYFPDLEGKPKFTPTAQERIAVELMEETNALPLLRSGDIAGTVEKLKGQWSSLPGGEQNANRRAAGKPMDMAYFMGIFDQYLIEEKNRYGLK